MLATKPRSFLRKSWVSQEHARILLGICLSACAHAHTALAQVLFVSLKKPSWASCFLIPVVFWGHLKLLLTSFTSAISACNNTLFFVTSSGAELYVKYPTWNVSHQRPNVWFWGQEILYTFVCICLYTYWFVMNIPRLMWSKCVLHSLRVLRC